MLRATLGAMSLRVCGSSFLTESKQNYIESAGFTSTSKPQVAHKLITLKARHPLRCCSGLFPLVSTPCFPPAYFCAT